MVELEHGEANRVGFEVSVHAELPVGDTITPELGKKMDEIRDRLGESLESLVPSDTKARIDRCRISLTLMIHWRRLLLFAAFTTWAASTAAQELEPGAYSVSPVGLNFLVVTNNFSRGGLTFDPALPIEDGEATINTTAFSYVRTLDFMNRSANVGIVAPYTIGHVEGLYIGEFAEVDRSGFRDPLVRFSVNLYGAPAMSPREFASYRQKTNIGLSLVMAVPLGEYDSSKVINLGSNRWSFRPEVGLSRAAGQWTFELYGGVWLFTDNEDFYGGKTRTQDPIGSAQVHVLRTFKPRLWAAFDVNYYTGGRTSVDGRANLDLQKNSRVGVTVSFPLGPRQSVKVAFSRGAQTTIGGDFDSIIAAYQYLWGGGL